MGIETLAPLRELSDIVANFLTSGIGHKAVVRQQQNGVMLYSEVKDEGAKMIELESVTDSLRRVLAQIGRRSK